MPSPTISASDEGLKTMWVASANSWGCDWDSAAMVDTPLALLMMLVTTVLGSVIFAVSSAMLDSSLVYLSSPKSCETNLAMSSSSPDLAPGALLPAPGTLGAVGLYDFA